MTHAKYGPRSKEGAPNKEDPIELHRNVILLNVGKGFVQKSFEILSLCESSSAMVVFLQDLGITEDERKKHFVQKDGTLVGKPYLLPGYSVFINEDLVEEVIGYAAIAVCNDQVDMTNKGLRVRRGTNSGVYDGRVITANIPTLNGEVVSCISVYAPNKFEEHGAFFIRLEKWLFKLRKKGRLIIVGGDFNAAISPQGRCGGSDEGNNMWPTAINEYGVDAVQLFKPCEAYFTWEGYEDRKATIDHIVVDSRLIDKCRAAFTITDVSVSDHKPLLLSIKLPIVPATVEPTHYRRLIDVSKLTAEGKLLMQEKLCKDVSRFETVMDEVLEGRGEEDRTKFYGLVNEFAGMVKDAAMEVAPKEELSRDKYRLPQGWVREVRELNREVKMCGEAIERFEERERREKNEHSTTFQVLNGEGCSGTRKLHRKNVVSRIREENRIRSMDERERRELLRREQKERIEKIRREAVDKENLRTPPYSYQSELRIEGVPNKVVDRMAFLGIRKWKDIANWNESDILPLAAIKLVSKSMGLGPVYWGKLRNFFREKVAVRKEWVSELYDMNDRAAEKGVLVILEGKHPFSIAYSDSITFVESIGHAMKKIPRGGFGIPTCEMALIMEWDRVMQVGQDIKGRRGEELKIRIRDVGGRNNVEKIVKKGEFEWKKEEGKEILTCSKMREMYANVTVELSKGTHETRVTVDENMNPREAASALREYRTRIRKKIREKSRELKRSNILKAIKKNNAMFYKSPKVLIKRKRAMLENTSRKKMCRVRDEEGDYVEEEEVLKSTYKYYSKTAEARPITEEVKYDFLDNCRKSIPEPFAETIEALCAPISMTETVRKIFGAGNGSAPGADGIPYEVLKALPDCTIRVINKIHNAMLERGWCPEVFRSGDVFLLAKVAEPAEHKDWRPVCLQATVYKILMAILADRMLHFALKNDIISEEQKGFCPVSGCFDHPALLMNIIENFKQNEGRMYILFVDFFNAYGSVDHRRLLQVLEACHISHKIVQFIKNTLDESTYRIHTGFGPTDPIMMLTGLKQGDPAAPVLFILFLEVLIRMVKKHCVGYEFKYPFKHEVPNSSSQEFADDMVFTISSEKEVMTILDILEEFDK